MRVCNKTLLFACLIGGAVLAADGPAPDPALLEYLGTYDSSAADGVDPVALAELDDATRQAADSEKTAASAGSRAQAAHTKEADDADSTTHP